MSRKSRPAPRFTPPARPAAEVSRPTLLGVGPPLPTGRRPGEDDIRILAYRKWEEAGRPDGDGVRYWLAAEEELCRKD